MGKMTNRTKTDQATSDDTRLTPSSPPPQLEGDPLLDWLREHNPASVPSVDALANVELTGHDWIKDSLYLHHGLYTEIFTASGEDVLAYFKQECPEAIFTEQGARLNGLYRERAEADGTPLGRWDMGSAFYSRTPG